MTSSDRGVATAVGTTSRVWSMSDLNASSSITIDARPATIFAILTDPSQHSRIDGSGTVRGSVSGDASLTLGSKFRMDMKMGAPYRINNKVVEFEPERRIAWRHIGLHRWRYELVPTGEGQTKVTETWDVSAYPSPIRKGLAWRFRPIATKSIARTLARLKDVAEADEIAAV